MSFSKEWDERYNADTNLSIWPWSDVVSYVMRYARPNTADCRVLELGCGAGANIPFFQNLGVQYYSIEGSISIVERLWERFPALKDRIVAGDFTADIPFPEQFDLIVDRSSLTHNTTSAIHGCLELVYQKLKPNGKFIGIDWFSTLHPDSKNGVPDEDIYTRRDFTHGQFAHVGRVHFSDKAHLLELFSKYEITIMEHKIIQREIPETGLTLAVWNFVAEKPNPLRINTK